MKLFVSAVLLAVAPAGFAQNQAAGQSSAVLQFDGAAPSPQQKDALEKAQAEAQALVDRMSQARCPLYMESASVAPSAAYLPVGSRSADEGSLHLHFRNQSGRQIVSASITARLSVKNSVYALDAHEIDVRLTFSGVDAAGKAVEQLRSIRLPEKAYLFGVTRVTLDQVTYGDGTMWTATPGDNACRTSGPGVAQIAK
jgi:hypothetical protein